ncbi:uncharacterized protein LOC144145263 [Haemaphysalis longicornis]
MIIAMVLVFCITIPSIWSCKTDPRDAVLHGTAVGRATHKVVRDCVPLLAKVKPPPTNDLAFRFLKNVCDFGQECEVTLKTTDLQPVVTCTKDKMWKVWGDHPLYSLEAKKQMEKIMLCSANASGSTKIAWLVTDVALRITG